MILGMKRMQSQSGKDRGGQGAECTEYESITGAQGQTQMCDGRHHVKRHQDILI